MSVDGIPELLAPAGSIECGLAAFDAGADAVYAGLSRFNARERGQNLSMEDISKLIAYARKHSRRVYVTMNTLVKDAELPGACKMLSELAALRPDAVLVQDIGLVRVIRDFFPVLDIHASTQMGIHNSAGANMAQQLGIKRVILERQVTQDEIAQIRCNTSVELEVFVHGALCCSRSGACLLSSWMGGWSGNRGKCKQPCRRRYHSDQGNGFFFSAADLYSLNAIPRLKTMGIDSFKIEGRLRKADYVNSVVSAYRMVLDAPEDEAPRILKKAKSVLSGSLGRKWSRPFSTAEDFEGVIQHEGLGASGLLCGKVIESKPKGFAVSVSRPFGVGDTIRLQPKTGDEGPAITVTRISVEQRNVRNTRRGELCWVHCDKKVPADSHVFRISGPVPDTHKRIEGLPAARPIVDLKLGIVGGLFTARVDQTDSQWSEELTVLAAKKRPLTSSAVEEEFSKSGSSGFATGKVVAEIPGNIFVPASDLKRLRRNFWTWADENVDATVVSQQGNEMLQRFMASLSNEPTSTSLHPEIVVKVNPGDTNPTQGSITAQSISDMVDYRTDEAILPDFCPEIELPDLKKRIDKAIEMGVRRFRVTSLYGLILLENQEDLIITVGFPLPVCNRASVEELTALGVAKTGLWVELDGKTVETLLRRYGPMAEVFSYGRIPLLTTRFEIPAEGTITDGRGAGFEIVKEQNQTLLLPEKVLAVPCPETASRFVDLTHAIPDEPAQSSFNYSRDLV